MSSGPAELRIQLYKAIAQKEHWHDVLRSLTEYTGCSRSLILLRERKTAELAVPEWLNSLKSPLIYGFSCEEIHDYVKQYQSDDPWREVEKRFHPNLPYAMSSYLPVHLLQQTHFWNWLEPMQVSDGVVLDIGSGDDYWVSLNLFFRAEDSSTRNKTLQVLTELQDCIQEAWALTHSNYKQSLLPSSVRFFLEQQPYPSFLVERCGNVVLMNEQAEQVIESSDNRFYIKQGQIRHLEPKTHKQVRSAILESQNATQAGQTTAEMQLKCFFATVTLIPEERDLVGRDTALRLLTLKPCELDFQHPEFPVWENPCLTKREQQLVQILAEGGKVVDFQEQYGVAKSTAHSHWGNVKRKLDVKDKAELFAVHKLFLEKCENQ